MPAHNEQIHHDAALVVTALFDSTTFIITDDNLDGDSDDSVQGILMSGQSYVMYIRDNGTNDDARYASDGIAKHDGDFFIVKSNKNILVSQTSIGDNQHCFIPAISSSSAGQKFLFYAGTSIESNFDLNAFAFKDSTCIKISRLSESPLTETGYTHLYQDSSVVLASLFISRGKDLIYHFGLGRNLIEPGHTYLVETSSPVSLQMGSLYEKERGCGSYVTASDGSTSGDEFYFAVPFENGFSGEQEIQINAYDTLTRVSLEVYANDVWVQLNEWQVNPDEVITWDGLSNGNVSYASVFRVRSMDGKWISVFESNALTSDYSGNSGVFSMPSANDGISAGKKFTVAIPKPSQQDNVFDPFNNQNFQGNQAHVYLIAAQPTAVRVKDLATNGSIINRSFILGTDSYRDLAINEQRWNLMLNNSNGSLPYLAIEADAPVSVIVGSTAGNRMMFCGSTRINQVSHTLIDSIIPVINPGDEITSEIAVHNSGNLSITQASAEIITGKGLQIISANYIDEENNSEIAAEIQLNSGISKAIFPALPDIDPGTETKIAVSFLATEYDNQVYTNGKYLNTYTSVVTGSANNRMQQSVATGSIITSEPEEPAFIFSELAVPQLDTLLTDSWTCSFVDYNNDGFDDLFLTERDISKPNYLFRNTGGNGFERVVTGSMLTMDAAISISSTWADADNDGDLDVLVLNNTLNPNFYYTNNGNGSFTLNQNPGFASEVSYYHGASWVDFDNDGLLDVYLSNFWSTRFNELWKNTGGGNFLRTDNNDISQTISQTVGATWADYNNDGFQDLFVPGNEGVANLLFRNSGNGNFERITNGVVINSGGFSVGSCWGDIDNDGDLDLFVANSGNQNNDLFINQGNGTFVKRLNGPEVSSGGHSHGCSFADIDNDADLDLYVTNDQGNKFLYLNDGSGNFTILDGELITDNFGLAFGHAWSDVDHDGDLDLAVATHSNQSNRIFINNGNLNHWIQIKLTGTNSNKSAIGAKVRILCNGIWQMRELNAQSGLGGQSSRIIHFGLGISNTIDSLIVYWPGGHLQRYADVNSDQIMAVTEQATSLVTGIVFADLNGNCIMDAGEPPIPDYQVSIPGYEYVTYTDENGEYSFDLPNGMYEMIINSGPSLSIACDSVFAFAVSPIIAQLEFLPIGLIPDCPGSETALVGFTTAMRRGFDNLYQVQLVNSGYSASGNDILNITFPEGISILSSNPQWIDVTTVNGGSTMVSFQVPPMQAQEYMNFNIIYNVGMELNIGEEISVYSTLEMQTPDCDQSNNSFNDFQTITGSFDPNDLLAWPEGTGAKKLITPENKITYRIRFQNVGNSYATHVTLHDIIPAALDPESISAMHASHPYFVSIHDNLLKVEFRNIYLPDSAQNEEASNGYFEFEIAIRDDAPAGAKIANRAAITFDFNEPIYTNEIIHTLVKPKAVAQDQLVLFPNPSGGEFFIVNPFEGQVLLRLISVDGSFIEKLFQDSELIHVNESQLISGFYVVEIISAEGEIRKGKMIIS